MPVNKDVTTVLRGKVVSQDCDCVNVEIKQVRGEAGVPHARDRDLRGVS